MSFVLPNLPSVTAEDQNAYTVGRYHPTLSDPFRETIADACPRSTGFFSTAREDSVNEMLAEAAENASGSRDHVQRMADGWKEDTTGVLIFVSPV
jgi:hypothetical protein